MDLGLGRMLLSLSNIHVTRKVCLMYYPYVKSQHPFRVLDGGPEGIVSADLLIWGMADIADQVAGDSVTKHRHIVELHNTPWGR